MELLRPSFTQIEGLGTDGDQYRWGIHVVEYRDRLAFSVREFDVDDGCRVRVRGIAGCAEAEQAGGG